MAVVTQRAIERETVFSRQNQIEQNQIGGMLSQKLMHFPSICRGRNAHAVSLQITGNQLAYAAVVVDNQYVIGFFHGL